MIVRYSISDTAIFAEQIAAISDSHYCGDILLEFSTTSLPENKTCLRNLLHLHRVMISLPVVNQESATAWVDAGATLVLFREQSDCPTKLELPIEEDRFQNTKSVEELVQISERNGNCCVSSRDVGLIADWLVESARTDRKDQLIPTIVCDEFGVALGLVYSNEESIRKSIATGKGIYWSRSRNELWEKGKTSGATQKLLKIDFDCDRDTLRFLVSQSGSGFCHLGQRSCFSANELDFAGIERHLATKMLEADPKSYTRKLRSNPEMLNAKIREEADELCRAEGAEETTWEAADLIYFALVKAASANIKLKDILSELKRRSLQKSRRPGTTKPEFEMTP